MGNNESVPSKIQILNIQNWVEAGEDQENAIFSNVNPFRRRLLANIITHQLIEEYELNFITEEDYNSHIAELSYRQMRSNSQNMNSHNFIYPIRYFINKSKHEMCTTIHTGYLYVDKVELRLKQINDIPFQDLLYMYKATLNGFKTLYQKVGYFDIVEEMIFITKRGEVKVWMNANLAKNYPNYQKNSYNSNMGEPSSQRQQQNIFGSQADMIRKLILMIEKNSDQFLDSNQYQPQMQNQLFSQFLQDKNIFDKLSFQHSLDEFQNYLRQNNLHSPDFMRSIPELFSPDELVNNGVTNYEQSHVNQITSQHLTQMKRKFQPMETILEDQKINTKTTYKMRNSRQKDNFQQSNVAMYTPPPFSNQRQVHFNQTHHPNVVRNGHAPFTDLNQSRYSQQSNKIGPNEYAHLQKSSNSSTNMNPYFNQKPNSVSTLNYNIQLQQGNNIVNQPQFHHQNRNLIILHPHQNVMNRSFGQPQVFHGNYPNEVNQKMMMISPPPSFRVMNRPNNSSYQQVIYQTQPIMLPPPSLFQNLHAQNRRFEQIQGTDNRQSLNPQTKTIALTKNLMQAKNKSPVAVQNGNNGNKIGSKQAQFRSSMGSQQKKKSPLRQMKRKRAQKEQKSKIKYFTKNDSYQLDEQIANDLEKFLGLKVN